MRQEQSLLSKIRHHPVAVLLVERDNLFQGMYGGAGAQPRQVLAAIPQLEVHEIPESELCCGSAGIYNLVEPEAAQELGERKARRLISADVQAVVSGNPGCMLQLQSSLAKAEPGASMPMLHLVELVDASIRNSRIGL